MPPAKSLHRPSLPALALACAPTGNGAASGEPALNMPNPASVHCEKRGGCLEICQTAAGQAGFCHLPSGTIIEEWKLFRRDQPAF